MGLHEEIEKVAYELYEKSGRADGRDVENWLEAERIVKARTAEGAKRPGIVQSVKKILKTPVPQKAEPQKKFQPKI